MSIPVEYQIDFSPLRQDLQQRAWSRLLMEFQNSPVLGQLLYALVSEIQALSDAIVDVIQYQSLWYAQGVNLDVIGRIVGQKRGSSQTGTAAIDTEDGLDITTETGETIVSATTLADSDSTYQNLILLRIASNFNKNSSIPELSHSIYQTTGVSAIFNRTGPMSVDIEIPGDTPDLTMDYLSQPLNNTKVERSFLFPYPATLDVAIVLASDIITEDGIGITTEDGKQIEQGIHIIPA